MEKERQAWADRLINSLKEVERLEPSPYLETRIRQQIKNRKREGLKERNRLRALSGALGVFVCLNIGSFVFFHQSDRGPSAGNKPEGVEALVKAYDLKISEY